MNPPHNDSTFRQVIGLLCIGAAICGFGGLYFVEVPPVNRDALMFALGNIFGWGAAVIASEYGASNTGRRVAEMAVRQLEAAPAGTTDSPLIVEGSSSPSAEPVAVKESE